MNSSSERAWVVETIRSAERSIARADYQKALEILHSVRRVEPRNMYVIAIIERVETLMHGSLKTASALQQLVDSTRPGTARDLSVTVGKNKVTGNLPQAAVEDSVEEKIKHFTSVASRLTEQGSYELAFESLMNAYLVDPTHPMVSECEKHLLPALEALRKGEAKSPPAKPPEEAREPAQQLDMSEYLTRVRQPVEPQESDPASAGGKKSLQARLEALKLQRDLERRERERAMWRAASSTPKNAFAASRETPVPKYQSATPERSAAPPKLKNT